jgi:hypothetical protein
MKQKRRETFLVGQTAEYLVSAELSRRGFVATPFSGNVPEFDLIITDERLKTIPVQIKAKRGKGGCWHGKSTDWMEIEFTDDGRQIIHGKTKITNPNLIYIYVELSEEYGSDRFFLLWKRQVQNILYKDHLAWNLAHNQRRPKNPKTTHVGLWIKDLEKYEDNWKILEEK